MTMFVTLFRHAERENSGSENPRLTTRGFTQAENLVQLHKMQKISNPTRLLVSPRLRAQQTLHSLSKHLNLQLEIRGELDERQSSESAPQFTERVMRFLQTVPSLQVNIYLCSHLDWIEESVLKIPCDRDLLQAQFQLWQPGQFIEFEIIDDIWEYRRSGVI